MFRLSHILFAGGFAFAAATATAADTTAEPRADVSRVCPGYGDVLRERVHLPPVYQPKDLVVRFHLEGGAVSPKGIEFKGTPVEWRRVIRRVMNDMECRDDGQGNQDFAFVLSLMPERDGVPQTLALKPESEVLAVVKSAD